MLIPFRMRLIIFIRCDLSWEGDISFISLCWVICFFKSAFCLSDILPLLILGFDSLLGGLIPLLPLPEPLPYAIYTLCQGFFRGNNLSAFCAVTLGLRFIALVGTRVADA